MSKMKLTNPAAIASPGVDIKIAKHKLSSRIAHGFVALAFCTLLVTGVLLFFGIDVPRAVMANLHGIMGIVFLGAPLIYVCVNYKSWARFVGTVFHYDKDDWGWIKAPMGGYLDPYLWHGEPEHYVPPQDKYNTGQKGAGVVLLLGAIVLAATGFLMWGNTADGILGLIKWEIAPGMTWFIWTLHGVAALVSVAIFAVHFFLGAIYPVTNVEFGTMFGNGIADYHYTEKKHGKWLETLEVMNEVEKPSTPEYLAKASAAEAPEKIAMNSAAATAANKKAIDEINAGK